HITCLTLFFHSTATTQIYTLSLHDALPISREILLGRPRSIKASKAARTVRPVKRTSSIKITCLPSISVGKSEPLTSGSSCTFVRSEEHTSELQSRFDLVCRLLLEKKNISVI